MVLIKKGKEMKIRNLPLRQRGRREAKKKGLILNKRTKSVSLSIKISFSTKLGPLT